MGSSRMILHNPCTMLCLIRKYYSYDIPANGIFRNYASWIHSPLPPPRHCCYRHRPAGLVRVSPVRPRRCNVIVPRILHLLFYEFPFRRSRCRPMCRRVGRAKEIHSPRHCRNRLSLTFATLRCRGPIGGSRHLQLVVIVIKFGAVSSSTPRQGRTRRPQPPPFC